MLTTPPGTRILFACLLTFCVVLVNIIPREVVWFVDNSTFMYVPVILSDATLRFCGVISSNMKGKEVIKYSSNANREVIPHEFIHFVMGEQMMSNT